MMRDFVECLGQIQISGIDIVCFASILAVTDYKKIPRGSSQASRAYVEKNLSVWGPGW